jgi:hypothetical protein
MPPLSNNTHNTTHGQLFASIIHIHPQVELAGISSPVHKLRRIASISKLFASELGSTVALAPFAVRALRLHKSLPHLDSYSSDDEQPVYVVKDVRYAEAPRALIDLYLPTEAAAAAAAAASRPEQQQQQQLAGQAGSGSSSGRGVPVVVFVHGGESRPMFSRQWGGQQLFAADSIAILEQVWQWCASVAEEQAAASPRHWRVKCGSSHHCRCTSHPS